MVEYEENSISYKYLHHLVNQLIKKSTTGRMQIICLVELFFWFNSLFCLHIRIDIKKNHKKQQPPPKNHKKLKDGL